MAVVNPFKGILYNPQKVDPSLTTAPPYDIVTSEFKDELYSKSPHNIIRIDFGKDSADDSETHNRYTRASKFLDDWLDEGVLTNDQEPLFYCYEITYSINGSERKTRGFLGAVKLEEMEYGRIHPHEMTYSKPKSDRLNILRYCKANISPIFALYSSQGKSASSILKKTVKEDPFIKAENGDGFVHRLWRIKNADEIEAIRNEMADKDIFIADGHHRYETALEFKKEMDAEGGIRGGEEPYNYVLMFLSNMEEEGLTLLPTHRIIEVDSDIKIKDTLNKHFTIQKITSDGMSDEESRQRMLETMRNSDDSFGMFLTNENTYYTVSFRDTDIDMDMPDCLKNLDVSVIHKLIFEKLLNVEHYEYEMDAGVAVERAKKSSFEAVFFLKPTKIHDVKEVALAGHRMPPKSTYFYPKLLTGMVVYKF